MREVRVELLLGRKVVDTDGRPTGRIEEVVADERDGECRVREFHLGPDALLERLAVSVSQLPFLGALARLARSYAVPWDRLELSDADRPRLTCRKDELPATRLSARTRASGRRRAAPSTAR